MFVLSLKIPEIKKKIIVCLNVGTGMPRICEDEEDKKDQSSAARNKYKRNDSLRPPTNVIGRNVSAVQLKSLRLVLFKKEIMM